MLLLLLLFQFYTVYKIWFCFAVMYLPLWLSVGCISTVPTPYLCLNPSILNNLCQDHYCVCFKVNIVGRQEDCQHPLNIYLSVNVTANKITALQQAMYTMFIVFIIYSFTCSFIHPFIYYFGCILSIMCKASVGCHLYVCLSVPSFQPRY